MKTKVQLYDELNNFFSSGQNLLRHINLESFYVAKELIDEINNDSALSEELKSLLKFQLYIEQFNNRVIGYLNNIRLIIFDKIDNPFEVKKKCDFLYKENQDLYYLFKRINPKYNEVNIEFNKENLEFLLLKNNFQKTPLTRDSVEPKFKLKTEYLDKQKFDESKIDDYAKKLIQIFAFNIYTEIANLNAEICKNNGTELSLYYTLEKVGDFVELSPISTKSKTTNILNPKPELLIDIWELDKDGNKEYYNEVIEKLQDFSDSIDHSFVKQVNGKLYWSNYPIKGHISYLAGFLHTCIEKKWIKDYSASVFRKIAINTFNFESIDKGKLTNLSIFNEEKYCKPFDFIKENTK